MKYTVTISVGDADTIRQFIEEDLPRFTAFCKANNIFPEDEIEEEVARLLDELED